MGQIKFTEVQTGQMIKIQFITAK